MGDIIFSTTDQIDGYKVKEYLGIVTGTHIYLAGGMIGGGMANQENLFGTAMEIAKGHIRAKAIVLGADAVIGIQTSFTSPGGANSMILALTGTAVKLEKSGFDDELPEL